jgi:hypothetical protein
MDVVVPRPVRRTLALVATLVGLALSGFLGPRAEAASPYTYYAERQRGDTLTIKHNPAPGIVVRNVRVKRAYRVHRHRVVRHAAVHRPVIRHRRIVRRTRARNVADPAIAGFCRDGGTWLRPASLGAPRIVQKEVCDSVAFYSQKPNDIVVRPDKSRLLPF